VIVWKTLNSTVVWKTGEASSSVLLFI